MNNSEVKKLAGGIMICDRLNNEDVIILGKSNIPKRNGVLEGFGGGAEDKDQTPLHTAVRELIEEFFNKPVDITLVNKCVQVLETNNHIKKVHKYYGVSYLIDFTGLECVFLEICSSYPELGPYKVNNKFELNKYIQERKIDENVTTWSGDGLNEIRSLHIIPISDVLEDKYKLRWYTHRIIHRMLNPKKIDNTTN